MEQLDRECMEIYNLKDIFNDICEMEYSQFRYLNANRLKIIISGKYSHMKKLISDLQYQLELDFDHISRVTIHREEESN